MVKLKKDVHIALVGCGAMGSALLTGWLSTSHIRKISVISPHQETVAPFLSDARVTWSVHPHDLCSPPDLFVFALKPFLLESVLPLYLSFKTLMVSVAAGKPLSFYATVFPTHPVVRVMPNLPVRYCQGVLGLLANERVSESHKAVIIACFQDLGQCHWLSSDEEMDKLTAVAGSGPAYVFFFMEALAQGAEALGFDPAMAMALASQTFLGASVCVHEAQKPPFLLRQQVTTPNGTTAAALHVLEEGQLRELVQLAVKAAFKRAEELGA